ncbi:MAG: tRNA (adenosine(37)-N6)-threonylcarbamoyltransferase complex transferase subunit TsaD [Deinococcales bacterium]|nr:tRNA (adenosine(37)-N6)-threonylcarbamoyltransferase complex transferase subunit TsaD [Deinococcales bacterium]
MEARPAPQPILGIDTSCDDTGVGIAVGERVLANVVVPQTALHARYGGVMPELASREHLEVIDEAVERALKEAGLELGDLGAVAATRGPGLVGALLVGLSYGKALAWGLGVPFLPVHHLHGHLAAASGVEPPFLALIASGGHTALFEVRAWDDVHQLGRTRDDAAGEAFDKVARLLGLGYPGGPALSELARQGDDHGVDLPWPMAGSKELDFSFSGLKTAVALLLERRPDVARADVAATFERIVVGSLLEVTRRAVERTGLERLVIAGGVAANRRLREAVADLGVETRFPPPALATDNGAMIALAGRLLLERGAPDGALAVDAEPYLPLA